MRWVHVLISLVSMTLSQAGVAAPLTTYKDRDIFILSQDVAATEEFNAAIAGGSDPRVAITPQLGRLYLRGANTCEEGLNRPCWLQENKNDSQVLTPSPSSGGSQQINFGYGRYVNAFALNLLDFVPADLGPWRGARIVLYDGEGAKHAVWLNGQTAGTQTDWFFGFFSEVGITRVEVVDIPTDTTELTWSFESLYRDAYRYRNLSGFGSPQLDGWLGAGEWRRETLNELPVIVESPGGPATGSLFILNDREDLYAALWLEGVMGDSIQMDVRAYPEAQADNLGGTGAQGNPLLSGQAPQTLVRNGIATAEVRMPLDPAEGPPLEADDLLALEIRVQVDTAPTVLVSLATLARPRINIDIKPGVAGNPLVPWDPDRLIPVAILSSPGEAFDATQVNASSVRFGPAGAWPAGVEAGDVNGDGVADLVLEFLNRWTGIRCGDTRVELTGTTFDGEKIRGSDGVSTRLACRWSPEEWANWNGR